jgi:4-hydroxy-tetrahydrodipicolinate synthase
MHEMCMAAIKGDAVLTRKLNAQLGTLNKLLFIESNPIPVKWAVAQMGLTQLGYRLPLTSLSEQHHAVVRNALKDVGLI